MSLCRPESGRAMVSWRPAISMGFSPSVIFNTFKSFGNCATAKRSRLVFRSGISPELEGPLTDRQLHDKREDSVIGVQRNFLSELCASLSAEANRRTDDLTCFRFQSHQGSKPAMEKQQIDEVFSSCDFQPVLAPDARKHSAHFAKEGLKPGEDSLFQLPLAVLVGEFQEVQRVLVLNGELRLMADALWKCGVEAGLIEPDLVRRSILNLMDQDVLSPSEMLRFAGGKIRVPRSPCTFQG
jgi:hypothetical protein